MQVTLSTLQPNPLRDFSIDPIDPKNVALLKDSIAEHGFWGGVACRQLPDGTLEIAAGHHRIQAAIEAGMTTADLYVRREVPDDEMLRLYATENATQRGNTTTALAGTVASAVRFLAKAILTGVSHKFVRNQHAQEIIEGRLTSESGIGEGLITDFLHDVPGVNVSAVRQQLANLKASGAYARIMANVEAELAEEAALAQAEADAATAEQARLEHEHREAEARAAQAEADRVEALARAQAAAEAKARQEEEAKAQAAEAARQQAEAEAKEASTQQAAATTRQAQASSKQAQAAKATESAKKAATTAATRPRTFDFEGVAQHLKNTLQVEVFRKIVTGAGVQPFLAVEDQAALAKHLVEHAAQHGIEISGVYIRDHIMSLLFQSRTTARAATKAEADAALRAEIVNRIDRWQRDFLHHVYAAITATERLKEIAEEWKRTRPQDDHLPLPTDFRRGITDMRKVLDSIIQALHNA